MSLFQYCEFSETGLFSNFNNILGFDCNFVFFFDEGIIL